MLSGIVTKVSVSRLGHYWFNAWFPKRCDLDFKCGIFKCIVVIIFMSIFSAIAFSECRRTPLIISQHWYHQVTTLIARFVGPSWGSSGADRWSLCWPHELCYLGSHFLKQCWLDCNTPYGIRRAQQINHILSKTKYFCISGRMYMYDNLMPVCNR